MSSRGALALLIGIGIAACDSAEPSKPPPEPKPSQGGTGGSGGTGGGNAEGGTGNYIMIPCGNGVLDDGEECDDDNRLNHDGCSDACHVELGAPCPEPDRCPHGNGKLDGAEQCDDGNHASMDGCDEGKLERGWACPTPGEPCRAICGDNETVGPETCDDGNTRSGDGCARNCRLEPLCNAPDAAAGGAGEGGASGAAGEPEAGGAGGAREGANACGAVCGDGIVSGDEQCDDGQNLGTYGGCRADCSYAPFCGDGRIDGAEQCDDGANVTEYGSIGCAPGCRIPHFCGDGVVDVEYGEMCDNGPTSSSACRNCRLYV